MKAGDYLLVTELIYTFVPELNVMLYNYTF